MTRECREYVVRLVLYCESVSPTVAGTRIHGKFVYLPNITQSPCEVAINNSIGSDSHAFVRDAINA